MSRHRSRGYLNLAPEEFEKPKPRTIWQITGWPFVILFCLPWWVGMFVIVKAVVAAL